MILKEECIKVGIIGKPHGVKGEVSFLLDDGFYAEDLEFEFLLLDIENGLVPFAAEELRVKSEKTLLVKFEDVNTESEARKYTGCEVYLEEEDVAAEAGSSTGALIGYAVEDLKQGSIGVLIEVQESENNPLFIIDHDGKEVLIPIHDDFIVDIDDTKKILNVELPEGLVDLYLNVDEEE